MNAIQPWNIVFLIGFIVFIAIRSVYTGVTKGERKAISRFGRLERFLDRLLLGSIIECRGAERFKLVCNNLKDRELKDFYRDLWASEAKHGNIFVKMALNYFDKNDVYDRLEELNRIEGNVLKTLPVKPALH